MSHITTVQTKIKDLRALAIAARELGGELVLDQKTQNFYSGTSPCDHAIKLPGVNYEVGVVKTEDGSYTLAHDPYGSSHTGRHDGHKLIEKFGTGLKKLAQSYSVAKATLEARARGWMVTRKNLPNGQVKLTMSGV